MPIVGDSCPPLAGQPNVRDDSLRTIREPFAVRKARYAAMTVQQKVELVYGPRQQVTPVNSDKRRQDARDDRFGTMGDLLSERIIPQPQRDTLAPGTNRGPTGWKARTERGLNNADQASPPVSTVVRSTLEFGVRTDASSYRLTKYGIWMAVVPALAVADPAASAAAADARDRALRYQRNGWAH